MTRAVNIVLTWGAAVALIAACAYAGQGGGVGLAVIVTYQLWNETLQGWIERPYLLVYNAVCRRQDTAMNTGYASILTGILAASGYAAASALLSY